MISQIQSKRGGTFRGAEIPISLEESIGECYSLQEMRDLITEVVLNRVGLAIATHSEADTDPHIVLTEAQYAAKAKVEEFGYRVTLAPTMKKVVA